MLKNDQMLRSERLAFYGPELEKMDRCLEEFLKLSGSRASLLVDRDGHLVTSQGKFRKVDFDTVSALVAGSFAATRQMALLMGEGEFNSLYHQGKKEHMLICLVGDRSLLTILFDDRTNLGMVRLYAIEAGKRLGAIFADVTRRQIEMEGGGSPGTLSPEFEKEAKDQLGEILGG